MPARRRSANPPAATFSACNNLPRCRLDRRGGRAYCHNVRFAMADNFATGACSRLPAER